MNIQGRALTTLLAVLPVTQALAGQHLGHEASTAEPDSAVVAQCTQAQPAIAAIVNAAAGRLEAARQTNSAATMRGAIDDLQATLREVRSRLAPCASLAPPMTPAAAPRQAPNPGPPAAEPHTGHSMPVAPDRR